MTTTQASHYNTRCNQELCPCVNLCRLLRRHAATLVIIRSYVDALRYSDYSGVTRNFFVHKGFGQYSLFGLLRRHT